MTGLECDGYRVLGVTIDGPDPLGRIHHDLRPGLSVLYGLNGVGKTRYLAALRATMLGYALDGGCGAIHVQIFDPSITPKEGFPGALWTGARVGSFLEESGVAIHDEGSALINAAGSFTQVVTEHLSRWESDWEWMGLAIDEAAAFGYFSLHAIGTTHPEWQIYVSDCIRPESPLAEAYRAAAPLAHRFREVMAGIERGEIGVTEYLEQAVEIGQEMTRSSPWKPGHPVFLDLLASSLSDRPLWVPVDIADVGRITVGPLNVISVDDDVPELDGRTARQLISQDGRLFQDTVPDALNEEGAARLEHLENTATQTLQELIGAGLELRFRLGTPEGWFLGEPPAWMGQDEYGSTVPINQLSASRKRWAVAAVRLALGDQRGADNPTIVLSDEPEAGVQRTGETQIAAGLSSLTASARRAGLVATHSPAFFRQPDARLLHVRRELSGDTEVRALDGLPRDEELGLSTADLLALCRVFVIVEGEHDKIVLATLFPLELQRSFAQILVLRGASQAVTLAHAHWLMAASDATFLIVLDTLSESTVRCSWKEARTLAAAGRIDDAISAVRAIKTIPKDEAGFLARLGEEAIRTGTIHRIHFFGLCLEDILFYLPDGLRLFKQKKQGSLANTEVQAAVRTLDTIHKDFTDLMVEIERLGALFGRGQLT